MFIIEYVATNVSCYCIYVYYCVLFFFEVYLQVLDFPVDNGGNILPLAEELYCIININF